MGPAIVGSKETAGGQRSRGQPASRGSTPDALLSFWAHGRRLQSGRGPLACLRCSFDERHDSLDDGLRQRGPGLDDDGQIRPF